MLARQIQSGRTIASNDNGIFAEVRRDSAMPVMDIVQVALAITGSISLNYVADGVTKISPRRVHSGCEAWFPGLRQGCASRGALSDSKSIPRSDAVDRRNG